MDVLTPIDEDLEEGDEEDPDDTPITMGAHLASRDNAAPSITHTAASPSDPPTPDHHNELSQKESVL